MDSPDQRPRVLSRSDTIGFVLFIVGGMAIAVAALVQTIAGLGPALRNQGVQLTAPIVGATVDAPIGPNGAPVAVALDTATIFAPPLQPAAQGALVISYAISAAAVITVVVLLLVLCFGILRGRIFRRRHTAIVSAAGIVAIAGMYFVPFFHNMAVNGAIALLSDYTYDRNVNASVDLLPIFAVAFVAALAGTAFAVGDRLQRDTEGLV